MVVLPAGVSAANISLAAVLELLDGPFKETAEGIANGEYVLWLGSGISRDRVAGLWGICQHVVRHLWDGRVLEGGAGPFTTALDKVISLADLSDAEKGAIDFAQEPEAWPVIDQLTGRLVKRYSSLLGVVVQGKEDDYLLWDVVNVPDTYGKPTLEPDCEHMCVALLALEGLVGNVATANWDGLIEKAIDQLSNATPGVLSVCVTAEDFGAGATRTRLLKFHGCAVRAKADAGTYRGYLVGRASQIVTWAKDEIYKLMRHELVAIASKSPSLVVGLSVQDFNIKAVFADGDDLKSHKYPSHPPAYVFAEQELGMDQEELLQAVYGSKDYAKHQAEIVETARIPAYAKPLLTAMVLSAFSSKLATYAKRADAPAFAGADWEKLAEGIIHLRDRIAKGGDGDRLAFVKALVDQTSKLLSAFRGANWPGAGRYAGLGTQPVTQIQGDPNLGVTGLPELANVAGMLGRVANDNWTMTVQDSGALEIDEAGKKRKLVVVASSDAAASLVANGNIDEDDGDTVIAICTALAVRRTRSPSAAPGRVMNPDRATDVAIRSILASAASADEAVQMFREQAGL